MSYRKHLKREAQKTFFEEKLFYAIQSPWAKEKRKAPDIPEILRD